MKKTNPLQRDLSSYPNIPVKKLVVACSLALVGWGSANAQEAKDQATQTITVTGIRGSLGNAMTMKRDAQGIVDGILAEDIGKMPDTNLAESLQRISGVSIDRSAGEGSKVTVRGVGPDFNLVLLNGRQMPTSNIQSNGASNSRAFDFANLASESVSGVQVFKTSRASTPTGGIGATINIMTARPLDNPGFHANVGIKSVHDTSLDELPGALKGDSYTPELSGIYSNTFDNGKFGIAISGSYQKRDSGFMQASVPNGWRGPFRGDENNWGTIPNVGAAGSELVTNHPKATDIYSVPQNLIYSANGIERTRKNGQLTLQFAPTKEIKTTLDYTFSENKVQTKRNELSAWFNFGPSTSAWTNGPVSGPTFYSETIPGNNSDLAMAGLRYGTKNENKSLGFNAEWKVSDRLTVEFDAHNSTAESSPDSPYGSFASIGTKSDNRGTTSVDFSRDFPRMTIAGAAADPTLMLGTGSTFQNSYTKNEIEQYQFKGKLKVLEYSRLDFGVSSTTMDNRSAFANVQNNNWGGTSGFGAAAYPDSAFHPAKMKFGTISGSGSGYISQYLIFDFDTVRNSLKAAGNDVHTPTAAEFTDDRYTQEKSKSAYLVFNTDWDTAMPINTAIGLRYEKTDVISRGKVTGYDSISWDAANEFTAHQTGSAFTSLKGKYDYFLPSVDFNIEPSDATKLRVSYGETIGRPGWGDIQGGQTINPLVRVDGGTGAQGDPSLKPLHSKNWDFSLEWYYDKGSYASVGYFQKAVENYVGTSQVNATPFNLHTPVGGALYLLGAAQCPGADPVCIRNWIFDNRSSSPGVNRTGVDSLGNRTGTITGQTSDPLANFKINVPANQKSDTIKGWELNVQHMFGKTGFGVSANFTKVTSGLKYNNAKIGEQFALEGLSDSANLVGFYEDAKWEVRAAYNWRDEFLSGRFDGAGPNPVYTEAYGQIDMNVAYKWNDKLTFQFEAININNGIQRLHSRTDEQLEYVTQAGPRYMIGARYKF